PGAGCRHHQAAPGIRGPSARAAGHALGGRASLALRGGGGVPPLLGAAHRGPPAPPSRALQELTMATRRGGAVTVNGRSYAWPDRPLVVMCIDGRSEDHTSELQSR